VDMLLSNIFAANFQNGTWNFDMIYDDDVKLFRDNRRSSALQIKSLIGAGLLVKF
jgi:hypothetical protein